MTMHLKELLINGFKSFASPLTLKFPTRITAIVGPNGSGKSNITEAFRFVLGEQSMKTLRSKRGEDLIFNGGTGKRRSSKAEVAVVFNNNNKLFGDAFNEVVIKRIVHRDGSNEYYQNDAQIRHREIIELLAKANIGATGHHIISQGESDRILNATIEERREMIEDGLGLKLLQYCKVESEKKIQKAEQNIEKVKSLQSELNPHITYLKKQVDRYQKTQSLRDALVKAYATYLSYEKNYFTREEKNFNEKQTVLKEKISQVDVSIESEKNVSQATNLAVEFKTNADVIRKELMRIATEKESLFRLLGRIEGELSIHKAKNEDTAFISKNAIQELYTDLRSVMQNAHTLEDYKTAFSVAIQKLQKMLNTNEKHIDRDSKQNIDLEYEYETKKNQLTSLETEEKKFFKKQEKLLQDQEKVIQSSKKSEQQLLSLVTEKNRLEQQLAEIRHNLEVIERDKEEFERELIEGEVLIGGAIHQYKSISLTTEGNIKDRQQQRERRKELERKKILLESLQSNEDSGATEEYDRLLERNEFLQKEKEDMLKSIKDLRNTIQTLQIEIDTRFKNGMRAINVEFEKFFKTLFGGGKARIETVTMQTTQRNNYNEKKKEIVADEEQHEVVKSTIGVVIKISLPHKKITALEQLSGGERALISIALLFAISQVTPPPFLILDETDAALDESNSRRYGDMIEELSKRSQLILITHNRETMYRAGALYGITMDSIGASNILSVQFDEAIQVAAN